MSESGIVQPTSVPTTTVPRDLLARLYREIGISAVAAALQVTVDRPQPSAHIEAPVPALPKVTYLAA